MTDTILIELQQFLNEQVAQLEFKNPLANPTMLNVDENIVTDLRDFSDDTIQQIANEKVTTDSKENQETIQDIQQLEAGHTSVLTITEKLANDAHVDSQGQDLSMTLNGLSQNDQLSVPNFESEKTNPVASTYISVHDMAVHGVDSPLENSILIQDLEMLSKLVESPGNNPVAQTAELYVELAEKQVQPVNSPIAQTAELYVEPISHIHDMESMDLDLIMPAAKQAVANSLIDKTAELHVDQEFSPDHLVKIEFSDSIDVVTPAEKQVAAENSPFLNTAELCVDQEFSHAYLMNIELLTPAEKQVAENSPIAKTAELCDVQEFPQAELLNLEFIEGMPIHLLGNIESHGEILGNYVVTRALKDLADVRHVEFDADPVTFALDMMEAGKLGSEPKVSHETADEFQQFVDQLYDQLAADYGINVNSGTEALNFGDVIQTGNALDSLIGSQPQPKLDTAVELGSAPGIQESGSHTDFAAPGIHLADPMVSHALDTSTPALI